MIVSVFVRRLRDGCTFEDFQEAWVAERGFGVPTRVFNAQGLDDPREIISIGFVDVPTEALAAGLTTSAASEAVRHSRIDEVIESTTLKAMYELRTEHDFTGAPQEIDPAGPASLLATLTGRGTGLR